MATITDPNYYVLAAEQNSYLCPEGSEISAADKYISLQDNITYCPEGEKMSLCLCGCGQECKEGNLYISRHNLRGRTPWNKGKTGVYSEETKKKLRLASLGRTNWSKGKTGVFSEETIDKLRLSHLGKKLSKEAIEKRTLTRSRLGISSGMKGKHHSKKTKEKIKLVNIGKKLSKETKEKIRANWKKHHSDESIERSRLARIGKARTEEAIEKMKLANLGRKRPKDVVERVRLANTGKKRSEITKERIRLARIGKPRPEIQGENHYNWKGGTTFLPYCSKFNKRLKERVRERDDRKCQLCGKTELENSAKLAVHHIHYDKENCYPDLLALCFRCNSAVNSNRDYWEKRCMEILEKRGLLNWKPVNVLENSMNARLGG